MGTLVPSRSPNWKHFSRTRLTRNAELPKVFVSASPAVLGSIPLRLWLGGSEHTYLIFLSDFLNRLCGQVGAEAMEMALATFGDLCPVDTAHFTPGGRRLCAPHYISLILVLVSMTYQGQEQHIL